MQVEKVVVSLRDHLCFHLVPAAVVVSGNESSMVVSLACGDDPDAAAVSFAAAHDGIFHEEDARRLAAALMERQKPFDYAAVCDGNEPIHGGRGKSFT